MIRSSLASRSENRRAFEAAPGRIFRKNYGETILSGQGDGSAVIDKG